MPTISQLLETASLLLGNAQTIAAENALSLPPNGVPVHDLTDFLVRLGLPEAGELLPPEMLSFASFRVTVFRVASSGRVSFSGKATAQSDVSGAPASWVLILGIAEVKEFNISATFDPSATGPRFWAKLSTTLDVGGFALSTSITLPELIVGGSAGPFTETRPNLRALCNKLNLTGGGFEDLAVRKAGFSTSLLNGISTFDLDVAEVWRLPALPPGLNFQIRNLQLSLLYLSGPEGGLTGSITGTAVLKTASDEIQFAGSASYDGPDSGWTFTGTARNLKVANPVGVVLGAFSVGALGVPSK